MKPLTLERFAALVHAYGSDLARFPEAERAAARTLLATSQEAQALLRAESGLDARLTSVEAPMLSATLERRLNEIPLRAPARRAWPFATRWVPALLWAGAAAAGVWLGGEFPDDATTTDAEIAMVDIAEDEEVYELAAGSYADLWEEP